jgi:chromate transporter
LTKRISLRHNRALNRALSAITAAVVGLVLNLAVWFALHTIFAPVNTLDFLGLSLLIPQPATLNWFALALSAAAIIATFRFHVGMFKVLAGCASGGVVQQML